LEVYVTKHAGKRLAERSGLNKKSMNRMANKAFHEGICISETKGAVYSWLISRQMVNPDANNLRVYGDKVWVFADTYLLTVLQVPSKLTTKLNKQHTQAKVSAI